MKTGVVVDVPMLSRTDFKAAHQILCCLCLPQLARVPHVIRTANQPTTLPIKVALKLCTQVIRSIVSNHRLSVADDHRQYMSGQCLVTACLDALTDNVEIPKGYAFLYTDAFGYDGCFAEAVLQANVRDPGTVRSCITVCHDMESQSYVTNLVGTTVLSMVKSKEPASTLQLAATMYLPGPRTLVVLERHVKRWLTDPMKGKEPSA